MIDLSNVTLIYHYRKDCEERLSNLKLSIDFHRKHFKNLEIILVEDDKELSINKEKDLEGKLDKIFFLKNTNIYARPASYNVAAKLSTRPIIMTMDTDVVVKPEFLEKAIKLLDDEKIGMIIPYNGIVLNTDEKIKAEFKETLDYEAFLPYVPKQFDIMYKEEHITVQHNRSVGGITIFKKDRFFDFGGYNPNFLGWGFEDNELVCRIKKMGYQIGRVTNDEAWIWHLSHPGTVKNNHPFYNNNQKINNVVAKMSKDELKMYIDSWSKNISNEYTNLLKGKRVAVVGPAPHIRGTKQRELIDSYDIVVRINKALPIPANLVEDVGTKTDILYNCLNPWEECGGAYNVDMWKKEGAQWVVCPYPPIPPHFSKDIKNFMEYNKNRVPFRYFPIGPYQELEKTLGTRPNSGYLAIIDLLMHDIEELYITGFSFFKGGYLPEYRQKNEQQVMEFMAKGCGHKQTPQIEHFKSIMRKDSRIKVDKFLEDMLK